MATVEAVHLQAVAPSVEGEEGEDEGEEEVAVWLKEIEEVAVQYVCLILEADGRGEMGGGKSPASLLSTVTPLSDGQLSAASSNAPEVRIQRISRGFGRSMVFEQIARKLKDIGDHLDARVKKEIVEAASALLTHRSVFQVDVCLPHSLLCLHCCVILCA